MLLSYSASKGGHKDIVDSMTQRLEFIQNLRDLIACREADETDEEYFWCYNQKFSNMMCDYYQDIAEIAVEYGHLDIVKEMVEELLKLRVYDNDKVILKAIVNGHSHIVKYLLKHKVKDINTLVKEAKNKDIIKLLKEK